MLATHEEELLHCGQRIAGLEVRIAGLEHLLARLLGDNAPPTKEEAFARTQKLAALDASNAADMHAAAAPGAGNLGITAAFATLDAAVAAASEAESRSNRLPDLSPVVPIDPSLIEDRFEVKPLPARRPRPTRLACRSALEEAHPKILQRLEVTWRAPECLAYLNRLIVADRNDRAGFDQSVMSELLFLTEILEAAASEDAWAANAQAY